MSKSDSSLDLYFGPRGTVGSDPEFFFIRDGEVVPSAEVLPENSRNVARDGFQGELHPAPSGCRVSAGSFLARAIFNARGYAREVGAELSFEPGHIISDEVWKKASPEMKRFGCNPTLSAQEKNPHRVTGLRERFRAGAGHIHLGNTMLRTNRTDQELAERFVKTLDIVAGNTLVLIDRDPLNAVRRKNYGRAGEYRLKSYGLEYRVPSNFWLKHYALWSFASQLCRNAMAIVEQNRDKELMSMISMKDVKKAINNNDYELALKNFDILSEFLTINRATGNGLGTERLVSTRKWLTSDEPLKFCNTMGKTYESWERKMVGGARGFERMIDNNLYHDDTV